MVIGILGSILIILLFALLTGILFRYLKLPVVLGYLLVGAVAGPHALGVIPNEENIKILSEFGIIFLMFTIGLEFSLSQLIALRYWVLVVGGLQVGLSILVIALISMTMGIQPMVGLVIGCIVAMSSTAIVTKELYQHSEIYSKVGKNSIGILLAQDIAVIPIIILLGGFSSDSSQGPWVGLILGLVKGIFVFALILFSRRLLLKPVFRIVTRTKTLELFTILVLLAVLSMSWLTHWFGLSYALGAFLAGVMLSETEFKHQIEIELRPFRDVLIGLFFITIGMLVNIAIGPTAWVSILLLVTALILGKIILIGLLCILSGDDYLTACRTGLILAQGGEFGFAILTFAVSKNLLPNHYSQVVLTALWISIVISPLLIHYNKQIATFLFPKLFQRKEESLINEISTKTSSLQNHIILCGFGHVGQNISRLLEIEQVPYVGLELDLVLVKNATLSGKRVSFGDACHPDILNAAGITNAKAIVVSFSDTTSAIKILKIAKQLKPSIPVLVRCKDENEIIELRMHGATIVIAEVFEEGLALAYHLLQFIKISEKRISNLIQEIRKRDYDLLRGVFPGADEINHSFNTYLQVRPIVLAENSYAIHHLLEEFNFQELEVEVLVIRRGKSEHLKPSPNIVLQLRDIVVLFGDEKNLEKAEKKLLEGQ